MAIPPRFAALPCERYSASSSCGCTPRKVPWNLVFRRESAVQDKAPLRFARWVTAQPGEPGSNAQADTCAINGKRPHPRVARGCGRVVDGGVSAGYGRLRASRSPRERNLRPFSPSPALPPWRLGLPGRSRPSAPSGSWSRGGQPIAP